MKARNYLRRRRQQRQVAAATLVPHYPRLFPKSLGRSVDLLPLFEFILCLLITCTATHDLRDAQDVSQSATHESTVQTRTPASGAEEFLADMELLVDSRVQALKQPVLGHEKNGHDTEYLIAIVNVGGALVTVSRDQTQSSLFRFFLAKNRYCPVQW